MNQYQPRHAAPARYQIPPPPAGPLPEEGPGQRPLRGPTAPRHWLGLAAAAAALLAFVALIIVVSLPASTSNETAGHPASGASRSAPHSGHPSPGAKGIRTSARHGGGRPRSAAGRATGPRPTTGLAARTSSHGSHSRAPAKKALGPHASPSSRKPASTAGTTSSAPALPAGAASSPAVDTATPAGFGPLLRRAWVSANPGGAGLTAADVQSTLAGSVYYASQPAIGVRWAISQFVPSQIALSRARTKSGQALLTQFQQVAIFDQVRGHPWQYVGSFAPGSCPTSVPAPVFSAWGLCQVGS